MARKPKPIQQAIQTAAARLAFWFIPLLPRWGLLLLARGLSRFVYLISGKLRRVGHANLQLVFGDEKSEKERREILRDVFHHFGIVVLDIFWFSRKPFERIERWVKFDPSAEVLFTEGPWVGITGHFGNWELLGQSIAAKGYPLASVAAPLSNPKVDELFIKLRQQTGQEILPQQGAMRGMVKCLRNKGRIALLLDQNTLPRNGGIFHEFFDRQVPISSAPAALALKNKAKVHFGFCLPQKDGTYHAYVRSSLDLSSGFDPREDITKVTRLMTEAMEFEIRENPGYWLWLYKRFKYLNVGEDPTRYPDYAREIKPREL